MNHFSETTATQVARRPARPGDEAFLFEVYASTRAEELAQVDWNDQQRESFLRMQFQAQDKHYRENYPGAEFQIIHVDGEPAGRLYSHHRPKEIRVMDIALLPRHRGQGIGTMLLGEILSSGAKSGKSVTIHVEVFNPALHWYERLGFKKVAANGPYLLMKWSPDRDSLRSPADRAVGA